MSLAGEGAITPEHIHWVLWRLPLPWMLYLLHARARAAGLKTIDRAPSTICDRVRRYMTAPAEPLAASAAPAEPFQY